ncbi:MAG: carbamoyl phosphate synthase small subunit [Acetilactobacillus jinshanensis]
MMGHRYLILADGTSYRGYGFGSDATTTGKLAINSNMLGYQESITNPAYYGQIIVFTQPSVGNTGINDKSYESIQPHTKGIIVREYANVSTNRNRRLSLDQFMKQNNIPGICGLDTREITRHIRKHGPMMASIVDVNDKHAFDQLHATVMNHQQVAQVATPKAYQNPGTGYNILVVDFGLKSNLFEALSERNCNVTVVPWNVSAQQIFNLDPDGVILSTGPGSPNNVPNFVLQMIQQVQTKIPLFAIGLGHELFALANGAVARPMPSGYFGSNHPVKRIITGEIVHVSQNQGYQILAQSLKKTPLFETYVDVINHSVQGLHHQNYPAFSVQFNPNGGPGPKDTTDLYDEFLENVRSFKSKR